MKETDWVNYRLLKEGEIIQKGDEVLCESKVGWVTTNERCVGTLVPNPQYTAHSIYRRHIKHGISPAKSQGGG